MGLLSLEMLYPHDELPAQGLRFERLRTAFAKGFPERALGRSDGRAPEASDIRYTSAPGRTELCGNHTDHNGGAVLAAGVCLDIVAAWLPRSDGLVRILSEGFDPIEFDIFTAKPMNAERGSSLALAKGVAAFLRRRSAHCRTSAQLRGLDAVVSSNLGVGSGLSSSAAFEVLVASMLADAWEADFGPLDLAEAGRFAENEYFGKPSGAMDQIASAFGGIVYIDFADPSAPRVERVDAAFPPRGYELCIVDTGGSHASLTAEYAAVPDDMRSVAALFGAHSLRDIRRADLAAQAAEIRAACTDRAFLRAWHFASETLLPLRLIEAVRAGDDAACLAIVKESGLSSWRFLQNVTEPGSAAKQELAVALALTEEFLKGSGAARVHGGGFAGTIQSYIPSGRLPEYTELMERTFGGGCVTALHLRKFGATRLDIATRSEQ